MKKVFVGMSGGVDSSVAAALLVEQGYNVTGVFMKNWAKDLPGFKCPWREDLADAKRVAVQLKIPFKMYDFQEQYKQQVVDYMISEYKAGRTPNPDIMCNQEVKFKLFLETALKDGADMIATGHYAQVEQKTKNKKQKNTIIPRLFEDPDDTAEPSELTFSKSEMKKDSFTLKQAVDDNKDQTYFLYRVTNNALSKTLFPLGAMKKSAVRKKAAKLGLITAEKKDSVGICFVGEIGIKEFLQNFVEAEPGTIVEKKSGKVIGMHDGALFYTIGQRHGLNVGGGIPYYVVGKSMKKNEVYVSTDLNDPDLWHATIRLAGTHWINDTPDNEKNLTVRVRHRGPQVLVKQIKLDSDDETTLILNEEIRALAAGQSAVLYQDGSCLGGGIIV